MKDLMKDLSTNQLMQAAGTLWQRRGKQPLKPLRSPMVVRHRLLGRFRTSPHPEPSCIQRCGKPERDTCIGAWQTFSADTCGAHYRNTPCSWPGSFPSPFPMCPPSDILDTPSVSQSCTLSPLLSCARCRLSCPVFLLVSVAQLGGLDSGIFSNLRPWLILFLRVSARIQAPFNVAAQCPKIER